MFHFRSSRPELFCKELVLRNFAKFTIFSCEFGEITKNIFSYRTPPVAASFISMDKKVKDFLVVN